MSEQKLTLNEWRQIRKLEEELACKHGRNYAIHCADCVGKTAGGSEQKDIIEDWLKIGKIPHVVIEKIQERIKRRGRKKVVVVSRTRRIVKTAAGLSAAALLAGFVFLEGGKLVYKIVEKEKDPKI